MYYKNFDPIDLRLLNPANPTGGGRKYSGGDPICQMIAKQWQELYDRYAPNEDITFVRPHMGSVQGQANMGGSYERSVKVDTPNGSVMVTWCNQTKVSANGQIEFLPKRFSHNVQQPLILNMANDIEQILWHCLFDGLSKQIFTFPAKDANGRPHPFAGKKLKKLYIFDPEDEAKAFVMAEEKTADLRGLIFGSLSPLGADREGLNLLASAWGVFKPEQMGDNSVKKELFQAVERAEMDKRTEFGFDAFIQAANDYLAKGNTDTVEMLALVKKAEDRQFIKYLSSKLTVELMNAEGQPIKKLCNIPPSKSGADQWRQVVVEYLRHNEDDLIAVQSAVDSKLIEQKKARKYDIPDNVTKEYILAMPYSEKVSICRTLNLMDIHQINKEKANNAVINYFITEKKKLPDDLKA